MHVNLFSIEELVFNYLLFHSLLILNNLFNQVASWHQKRFYLESLGDIPARFVYYSRLYLRTRYWYTPVSCFV